MGARVNQRMKAAVAAAQREQILEGFAAAIAAKGYQATTIADIAARARISKTTFYEHFADKEAVFLALHATVADATTAAIGRRSRETADLTDGRSRLRAVVDGYLDAMARTPAFLLQVMAEAAVASPATRAAREQALDRFASLLTGATEELRRARPGTAPVPHDLAVATMAGILELVSRAAPAGPDAVRALGASVSELLARIVAPAGPVKARARATARATKPPGSRAGTRTRRPRAAASRRSAR